MKFNENDLKHGQRNIEKAKETPNTFSEISGTSAVNLQGEMKNASGRMAGKEGARAVEMMMNPAEAERTGRWMRMFGMTNEGMQFNQAKMGLPPEV